MNGAQQNSFAGQQYVQQQQGNYPQSTGVPQMPYGQQPVQSNGGYEYGIDRLPPPPQRGAPPQSFQTQPQGNWPQNGSIPGAQVQPPAYDPRGQQQQAPQFPPQQFPPQPPQQPQAPQGPQTAHLSDNVRLDGPDVPPELRGRTWGEARRLYTALATDFRQRVQPPQTPAAQSLQQQGINPNAPQQQTPQGQPGQPTDSRSFFQNPDARIAEVVRQQIQETVVPMLQPVVQQTQSAQVMQAREVARTGMPDYDDLEPEIIQTLSGTPPQALADPNVWMAAAHMARGRMMAEGRYQPRQRQQPQGVPGQHRGPGVAQPAGQPQAPVYSFFSEGPTTPSAYSNGASGEVQPTQQDYTNATKFGMSINDWMAWKVGQPTQQQGGGW